MDDDEELDPDVSRYVDVMDLAAAAGDGVVVKRLARDAAGWRLVSDHPAWADRPWGETVMIGQVVWTARSLLR